MSGTAAYEAKLPWSGLGEEQKGPMPPVGATTADPEGFLKLIARARRHAVYEFVGTFTSQQRTVYRQDRAASLLANARLLENLERDQLSMLFAKRFSTNQTQDAAMGRLEAFRARPGVFVPPFTP